MQAKWSRERIDRTLKKNQMTKEVTSFFSFHSQAHYLFTCLFPWQITSVHNIFSCYRISLRVRCLEISALVSLQNWSELRVQPTPDFFLCNWMSFPSTSFGQVYCIVYPYTPIPTHFDMNLSLFTHLLLFFHS